jgi:hypothetical protein
VKRSRIESRELPLEIADDDFDPLAFQRRAAARAPRLELFYGATLCRMAFPTRGTCACIRTARRRTKTQRILVRDEAKRLVDAFGVHESQIRPNVRILHLHGPIGTAPTPAVANHIKIKRSPKDI